MSARTARALLGAEARVTIRDAAGLLVPLGLPLLLLVVSAMQPTTGVEVAADRTALEAIVVPSTIAMTATMLAVVNMPSFVATYRTAGVLRTLSTTPIRPISVLAAQVGVSIAQLLLGIAAMLAAAAIALGVRPPVDLGAALLVAALAVPALYALGMVVAALARTPSAALAIGLVVFLGTGALGGMLGPNDAYPPALAAVGDALPFGALVQGLQAAWIGRGIEPASVVALLVATAVAVPLAAVLLRIRR